MVDKKDRKILQELRKDSKLPTRIIAERTGLRPSTVHSRIQKLIETGAIERFTVKTDDSMLQENFIVFIMVSTEKEIPNSFFDHGQIKEVFGLTGEFDLLIKCKFAGIDEFNRFILSFRKIPQVKKTVTMIGTTKIKESV